MLLHLPLFHSLLFIILISLFPLPKKHDQVTQKRLYHFVMRRSSSPFGEAQQANKSQKRSQHSSPSSPESTTAASSIPTSKPIRHDSVTAPILPTTTSNIAMQRDTGLMTPDPGTCLPSMLNGDTKRVQDTNVIILNTRQRLRILAYIRRIHCKRFA